jgi:hypothetical protein
MLGWLTYEQGIEPHVSVTDKSGRRDGTFQRSDFAFDHAGDVYSGLCVVKVGDQLLRLNRATPSVQARYSRGLDFARARR